jgi:hypothetical protein
MWRRGGRQALGGLGVTGTKGHDGWRSRRWDYTLLPTAYSLLPTPYAYTLLPTPYTLYPTPYTLHPTPESPDSQLETRNPEP